MIADLRILPRAWRRDLGFAGLCGLGFGAGMALADASVFAGAIPHGQMVLVHTSNAWMRVLLYLPGVAKDELIYRLGVMSALVWVFLRTGGKVTARWPYWPYGLAIVLTALVAYPLGHRAYLAGLTPSALTIVREVTEHGGAGVLWGWLYWRRGLLAAFVGHVAAHITLDPLLSWLT